MITHYMQIFLQETNDDDTLFFVVQKKIKRKTQFGGCFPRMPCQNIILFSFQRRRAQTKYSIQINKNICSFLTITTHTSNCQLNCITFIVFVSSANGPQPFPHKYIFILFNVSINLFCVSYDALSREDIFREDL